MNVLHIWGALLKEALFPKGVGLKSFQYEMRAIFTEKSRTRHFFIIMHKLENVKLESTEILEIRFFLFTSSDSFHKKMLLESLNKKKCKFEVINRIYEPRQ